MFYLCPVALGGLAIILLFWKDIRNKCHSKNAQKKPQDNTNNPRCPVPTIRKETDLCKTTNDSNNGIYEQGYYDNNPVSTPLVFGKHLNKSGNAASAYNGGKGENDKSSPPIPLKQINSPVIGYKRYRKDEDNKECLEDTHPFFLRHIIRIIRRLK